MTARDMVDLPPAPWSAEAEQSVLGALMLDSDALLRIADRRLQAGHFFDHRHRALFAGISALHAKRQPVDVVTLFEHLRGQDQHEEVGGLAYINDLAQCVPSATNIARHADIVIDRAMRRSIVAAAEQAGVLALGAGSADELLDQTETLFASLRRERTGSSLRRASDLLNERAAHWEALEAGKVAPGITTGLQELDGVLGGGVKAARNIVLAARPGTGKTSLAWQIAAQVAQRAPVLVLSMEMQGGELMDRAAANVGGVPLERFSTGRFEYGDWSRITGALDALRELPLYVDDRPALTLLDIRARARQVQQQAAGLALVVVDYLQLASATGDFRTRHHAIEHISRGMKAMAKELGTCVLLLSQLTRDAEGAEPELHHLKESGAIEEDADSVLLLHPLGSNAPEGGTLVMLKVAKNRHGKRGRLGLAFDPRMQRWQTSTGDVARKAEWSKRS